MEDIAEKISRLPPDLKQEVENYIDFLLSRQSPHEKHDDIPAFLTPPATSAPSKPIILADEIPFSHDPDILPGYKDLGQLPELGGEEKVKKDPSVRLRKQKPSDPGKKLLDWID